MIFNPSRRAVRLGKLCLKLQSSKLKKNTDKPSVTCFKRILKISRSNYLLFCSNLTVKFSIFLKSGLLFNSFYCLFCL